MFFTNERSRASKGNVYFENEGSKIAARSKKQRFVQNKGSEIMASSKKKRFFKVKAVKLAKIVALSKMQRLFSK